MAVTFVLGRAGSGKTRYCLEAVRAALDDPEDRRRLILLVPEQASFQMERALASACSRSGYWRAEVVSFSRLARRALGQIGGDLIQLSSRARAMALRGCAARMGPSLRFYRQLARSRGFYTQLDRLIDELLAEDVSWEALAASARALEDPAGRRKVAEIARLYREYLAWLGPQRLDPAQRLAVLRERIGRLPWLADAAIWVDGFAGFTGQELATLVALGQTARALTITLLVDPHAPAIRFPSQSPDLLDLFHRTEQTYQRLRQLFAQAQVTCCAPIMLRPDPMPRFAASPQLARLEAGLATPAGAVPACSWPPEDEPQVRLYEFATHRDELRAAARFIRQTMADANGHLRFRDFAVIARDLEPFAQVVAEVFENYEIPHFLDRRRPMRAHPLSRLLDALLAAIAEDYSVGAMTRLLRTGLLPLTRTETEELDNLIVNHRVRGAAAWREPAWDFSGDPGLRRVARADPRIDAARLRVVAQLEPLRQSAEGPQPPTARAWARTLHATLEALSVPRRIEQWIAAQRAQRDWERAETHRLAWEAVRQTLEDLHDVLGDTPLRVDEVAGLISSALREQTLGLAPPTLDQVLVSSIERSRHPEIKYAWVFAFNEGIFPARPPEDEILSTPERETLARTGLAAPRSHRDQAFAERLLAYIALTRPGTGLVISYATVADDGSTLLPSTLLDEVRAALPELQVQTAAADVPSAVQRPDASPPPVCLTELAYNYLCARFRSTSMPQALARYERLRRRVAASVEADRRLEWLLRGTGYRNAAETIGNYRPTPTPDVAWSGSPSEVETYLDCPFKHLASYGLRLDPARGPWPIAWDLGSAAHDILAEVTRRALADPPGVDWLANDRWEALLGEVLAEFRARWPADLAQRRPDWPFFCQRLYDFVAELLGVQVARWRRGRFRPAGSEVTFQDRSGRRPPGRPHGLSDLPALELRLADGRRVQLRGRIDRIDRFQDDRQTVLLAYDYKSSGVRSPRAPFVTGVQLQVLSYLLALEAAVADEPDTRVAGVLLAPLYPDPQVLSMQYVQKAPPEERQMHLYRPRGLFIPEAARLLDTQLGQCASPVACMKLRKDGQFDTRQSQDVISPEDLRQRLELARRTILQAVEGIVAGRVEAAPLLTPSGLACRLCDFRPVCRFDRALNRSRVAQASLPVLERPAADSEEAEA